MPEDPNISRRELLRGRFLGGFLKKVGDSVADRLPVSDVDEANEREHAASSSRYRQSFPVLRPPGAIEEDAFLDGCTRCDACLEACPHDAIVHAPIRFRNAAGTPMIDPLGTYGGGPCKMCEDFPCIASCEPNVLRMDMPKKMGSARIDITTCLAHTGTFCTVCSEHCPVDGAIELTNGKPRIIESTCTGCGVCQHVCPAPGNAVLHMPVAERPPPPDDGERDHKTGDSDATAQADGGTNSGSD